MKNIDWDYTKVLIDDKFRTIIATKVIYWNLDQATQPKRVKHVKNKISFKIAKSEILKTFKIQIIAIEIPER